MKTQTIRNTDSPRNSTHGATKLALLLLGLTILSGCGTARISSRQELAPAPAGRPTVVWVADFDLDTTSIKSRKGTLPSPSKLPGPAGDLLPALPGAQKDPQKLSRKLVVTMSEALVRDLSKSGLTARRLPGTASSTNALPTSGWLVRGVFTEVNQGNQLRRAVLGFGLGKTELHALVDLVDLSHGVPQPFCELTTTADSGKAPGSGPTMVTAARLVITGQDLNQNVKQTAAEIAKQVSARCEPQRVVAVVNKL